MHKLHVVSAFCAGLVLSAPVQAEGGNAAGYGLLSCSAANERFEQPVFRAAFLGWAMGFMSGANMAMMSTARSYRDLSNLNADFVIGSLRSFCAENAAATVMHGVEQFYGSRPVRKWSPPP